MFIAVYTIISKLSSNNFSFSFNSVLTFTLISDFIHNDAKFFDEDLVKNRLSLCRSSVKKFESDQNGDWSSQILPEPQLNMQVQWRLKSILSEVFDDSNCYLNVKCDICSSNVGKLDHIFH